ncbi:hypothetical protein GQX73_g10295 [Xylaria multiplex]|uniref:Uncharacterized protein n=1 Tax=Xylaria multiplex TaxID=323545 RepID=A0A7C8IPK9_9PEZI|nr:hypothetical protein GQX73_g10295 [Xylaria multiplex]
MPFTRKNFKLPLGPPARLIAFMPRAKGLREYAEQHCIRASALSDVDIAISLAFVAFGRHPDMYPDTRESLIDVFGLGYDYADETVADRIRRYQAPKHVKTAHGLVEWYMEREFPSTYAENQARLHFTMYDGFEEVEYNAPNYEDQDNASRRTRKRQHPGQRGRVHENDARGDEGDIENGGGNDNDNAMPPPAKETTATTLAGWNTSRISIGVVGNR